VLTFDEARRIAANVVELLEFLGVRHVGENATRAALASGKENIKGRGKCRQA
jgi:hypothetical protein